MEAWPYKSECITRELCTTISRNLRGERTYSNSEIYPAKAQSRKVWREEIVIPKNGFHPYSPSFAALASLREIFRASVAALPR